jgi:hypothetical protein
MPLVEKTFREIFFAESKRPQYGDAWITGKCVREFRGNSSPRTI